MIPRTIHQTWRTLSAPQPYPLLMETWKSAHPGWEYMFWTDADMYQLVRECYPALWPVFDALVLSIEKVDIARWLMLHRYGGIYADLDTECIAPFDPLIEGRNCVLFQEPAEHRYDTAPGGLVSNAVMAATPGHPLVEEIIAGFRRLAPDSSNLSAVVGRTGPAMLARLIEHSGVNDYSILEAYRISPFVDDDPRLGRLLNDPNARELRCELADQGTHAIHYWFHSWIREQMADIAGRTPEIPGYTFYPGLDSRGGDHPGRYHDLPSILEDAEKLRAPAFNTAGYLKFRVLPPSEWASWPGAGNNEGLYVRNAYHYGGRRP